MGQKGLISVSTFSVAKEYNFSRIDDDIILFDNFGKLPVPCEPSRNMGLIIGLCLQGSFRYTADTVEQCVHAGEAMIIHEGQVVESAMIYDLSNAIYRIQLRSDKKPTRAEAIFSDFIRLVEQNYRSERRVGWYAHEMCITAKYLSETVKMVSRRTPNDWIDNYVVMELRVLLKNTTKSIKEISQDMCFPNQSFMGKYFKEHVGMSPMSYRKS